MPTSLRAHERAVAADCPGDYDDSAELSLQLSNQVMFGRRQLARTFLVADTLRHRLGLVGRTYA